MKAVSIKELIKKVTSVLNGADAYFTNRCISAKLGIGGSDFLISGQRFNNCDPNSLTISERRWAA